MWIRPRTNIFAAAIIMLLAAALAQAQCRPGDTLIGEDANNYYCMAAAKFAGSPTQKFGAQFCQAQRVVAADQNAIANLGFALDASRFALFGDVAQAQKAALQNKLYDEMVTQTLEATVLLAHSAQSLNPWNVNNAAQLLQNHGFDNQALVAALRRVAAQKGKPAIAAAYESFVDLAKGAQQGYRANQDIALDPANAHLRLLLGALKAVQGNYELGLVVSSFEFAESAVYLVYLSVATNAVAQLTDGQLQQLPALSTRLQAHVAAMLRAQNDWQQASAHPGAVPECSP